MNLDFSYTDDLTSGTCSIFAYGKPGCGKTSLIKTVPEGKGLVLAFEKSGIKSLRHVRQPYIEIESSDHAFAIQDAFMMGDAKVRGIEWVVIDTATEFMIMLLAGICNGRKPLYGDWDTLASETERFIANWNKAGVNVLFLAHSSVSEEEDSSGEKRLYIKPNLIGKAVENRQVFARFVDLITYAYTTEGEGGLQYNLLLQGTSSIQARGRFGTNVVPPVLDHTGRADTLQHLRSLLVN